MFIIANSVAFFDPLKKATDYVFYSLIHSYLRSHNLHLISYICNTKKWDYEARKIEHFVFYFKR